MSDSRSVTAVALPSGTVTFLFTDIEGSTRRWEQNPAAMRVVLARHDRLLHRAIEEHGGYVFKTVGDAFCAAFGDAASALDAALHVQRSLLAEESWGELEELRVRTALHTGESQEQAGDYFGPAVNRVARILSAAHGGQILISLATQQALGDGLPAAVELKDMGTHRLKDITLAERLYQIVAPDLPAVFPALRTLDNHPNNLPSQSTPLVGREAEIDRASELLRRPGVRLLTLTGAGGIGKTRLSLGVAAEMLEQFRDGVFFVEIAAITDPELVVPEIARDLGLREVKGQLLLATVQDHLRDRQILLVLDNLEQVVAAAPQMASLLNASPGLKILATSREVLRLSMEHEFPVPTLSLPDLQDLPPVEELLHYEAVALFVERARAAKPSFELDASNARAVVEICARLDGLPLAIELAAAHVRFLPPRAMLQRLGSRLRLLQGGGRDLPSRQQTLRNTIDWSHSLLTPAEQQLFRRLSVFVGGHTLEAAEAVCDATGDLAIGPLDGIESLADKSLLAERDGPEGEPRFVMLETIREYALERLEESGEAEGLRQRHACFFLGFAQEAEPELTGREQAVWLQRLDEEHENLRAVLQWSIDAGEAAECGGAGHVGLRLSAAVWRFWWMRGYLNEGRRWLSTTLAMENGEAELKRVRASALDGLGMLTWNQGDFPGARALFQESLSLMREMDDPMGASLALHYLANVAFAEEDFAVARSLYEESLALRRELGDRRGVAVLLGNLAMVACEEGDLPAARSLLGEDLSLQRALGDKQGIAYALNNLGIVAVRQGDFVAARSLFLESLVLLRELNDKRSILYCLEGLAGVEGELGRPRCTAVLCAAAEALLAVLGATLPPWERSQFEQILSRAREELGDEAWAEASAQGRMMTLEQAIAFALTADALPRPVRSTSG